MSVRAIFVVGSPRSGTTMIGNYIGSASSVLNAGEYRAFYLTYGSLPMQLHGSLTGLVPADWEPHRDQYVREAQEHAVDFIVREAERQGRAAFCDSFPRNLFIAPRLMELFPDALFVLTVRHYTGTIQSMLRLGTITILPGNEPAIDRIDPTAIAAATLWSRHYEAALRLPIDRTIPFGYDRFCADPEPALADFKDDLTAAGFPVGELDDSVFANSYGARLDEPRATVGSDAGGRLRLSAKPSFDAASWTAAIEEGVQPVVLGVDALLRDLFPEDYSAPAGYPGAKALLAASQREIEPSPPAAGAVRQDAAPPDRPRDPAAR